MKRDDQKALDAQTAAARRKNGTGNLTGVFLLVGCVTLEKARNWFGVAAEVCDTVIKIKERCHDRK